MKAGKGGAGRLGVIGFVLTAVSSALGVNVRDYGGEYHDSINTNSIMNKKDWQKQYLDSLKKLEQQSGGEAQSVSHQKTHSETYTENQKSSESYTQSQGVSSSSDTKIDYETAFARWIEEKYRNGELQKFLPDLPVVNVDSPDRVLLHNKIDELAVKDPKKFEKLAEWFYKETQRGPQVNEEEIMKNVQEGDKVKTEVQEKNAQMPQEIQKEERDTRGKIKGVQKKNVPQLKLTNNQKQPTQNPPKK